MKRLVEAIGWFVFGGIVFAAAAFMVTSISVGGWLIATGDSVICP